MKRDEGKNVGFLAHASASGDGVEVETKHVIMTLLIGERFEMTFYNATLYVMDVKTRHKLFITKPTRIGT